MADEFTDIRSALADGIASSEPAVMDAVLDLAFGDDDRPDTALDGDEAWRLLAVVYTVVETLHECAGAPRFAPEPAETGAEGGASAGGPLHIALAWYTPEQWQRLRETADDVDALDDTYDAWLAGAREAEAELAADGLRTERVMIDVDHLLRWCADTGRRVTAASRAAYASWLQRTRRQGDQDGRADLQPPANK